ncbi:MAG TPA: ferric reductase-like transmembrane domain-containing protein [Solirubrobacteraceae bacterium]|nr:ferric reductase-like transmembrane domain-containing protein [Solirubrobacteraceae bacterium]
MTPELLAASSGSSGYWYLTRSTGTVALLLLTASVVLGVVDVRRWSSQRWPRFVIDSLHRNTALLAMVFLVLHILTSVLDGFAPISLADAIVPFGGSYRPLWLGLGAVSFDLLIAIVLTSVMRARIGVTTWRTVHWLVYASWPIALLHGLGTGSDVTRTWQLAISVVCAAGVLLALLARVLDRAAASPAARNAALGGAGAFSLFLALWLPSGPLGSDWARRSGTPTSLLPHASAHNKGAKR